MDNNNNNKRELTPFELADKPCDGFEYNRRLIDGTVTGRCACLAYCTYEEHEGFLTQKLMTEHNCIGNGCKYFSPKPKEEKEEKEKQATAKAKVVFDEKRMLEIANKASKGYGDFRIYSAERSASGEWTLLFAAFRRDYPVSRLEKIVKSVTSEIVHIVPGKLNEDEVFQVLYG